MVVASEEKIPFNSAMTKKPLDPAAKLTLVVVILVLGYFLFENFFTYTTNAYVASDVLIVSPQVDGHIKHINVKRNQRVEQGQPLVLIDPEPFALQLEAKQAALLQMQANLRAAKAQTALSQAQRDEARATLDNARVRLERAQALLEKNDYSKQKFDDIREDYQVDEAALAAAEKQISLDRELEKLQAANVQEAVAEVARARYQLQQTRMTTPVDGTIAPFVVRPGAYVDSGTPLMGVISDDDWRVVANVRQRHAARLEPGMTVWLQLSTDPWRIHRGTVRSIAPGISRRESDVTVLPFIPLSTDWIRLSQRFPVEVDLGDLDRRKLLHGGDARIFVFH